MNMIIHSKVDVVLTFACYFSKIQFNSIIFPSVLRYCMSHSFFTNHKTHQFSITKSSMLMLFMEKIAVYSEHNTIPYTHCEQNAEVFGVKPGDMF
jgi:hypothetical protein